MKYFLIGAGICRENELQDLALPPAWRKATRNMVMATTSVQRALSFLPEGISRQEIALVVGSNSGELETSVDFLVTLANTGVARPLLFQNSLHNATTGFIAIQCGLNGPTFSVSNHLRTPQDSIDLGYDLLASGAAKLVLVTLVEGHRKISERFGVEVAEGAVTALLCRNDDHGSYELSMQWAGEYQQQASSQPLVDITQSPFFEFVSQWLNKK